MTSLRRGFESIWTLTKRPAGLGLIDPTIKSAESFVERVLGIDVSTISGTSRLMLLGEIHVRILSFSKMMSMLEGAL